MIEVVEREGNAGRATELADLAAVGDDRRLELPPAVPVAHHLVWTTGGHTYAVGFHDWNPRAVTRAMDLELVRHIRLVEP